MLQAVLFDMGGTIETFWHTPELRLQATPGIEAILRSAGIDLHLTNEQLYELVTEGFLRYHKWSLQTLEELTTSQIWCDYIFGGLNVDQQALDSISEELTTYYETQYYHREMRPEIPAVLDAIRSMNLKIGLISNVRSHGQVPTNLTAYGIRSFFDPVVLSSEYGRRKPDPAIFHYAARLARVPTSACVFVGDRIARDVVGARKAGYKLAVQIEHDFPAGEEDNGGTPDFVIHEMTELVDILRAEMLLPDTSPYPIRALIFDAGDILYHRPRRGEALKHYLSTFGVTDTGQFKTKQKKLEQLAYHGHINQDEYRQGLIRVYGINNPQDVRRGARILEGEDHDIQFFDGVQETLASLKARGYWLGIVTDTSTPVSDKLRWFESGGFGHIWDSIISSRELGVRKPDPGIYTAALQQLNLRPEEAVFIGHKASELEGARRVGMHTIAFNYEARAEADIYINNFSELLEVPLLA